MTLLAGCGSSHRASTVPTLPHSAATAPSAGSSSTASRGAQLHAAAQCIRTHGIPTYQDPVLGTNGQVYTDARSVEDFEAAAAPSSGRGDRDSALTGIRQACGTLIAAAGFQPADEASAPPALVLAGVRAAQCLRAHGLPNYRDPTSATPFTPGHGFGITNDELPNNGAAGKLDPTFQAALAACRQQLDAEVSASNLSSLAHD